MMPVEMIAFALKIGGSWPTKNQVATEEIKTTERRSHFLLNRIVNRYEKSIVLVVFSKNTGGCMLKKIKCPAVNGGRNWDYGNNVFFK
jgi:hypothetical protein